VNVPPGMAYELARQRQYDLIASAERYHRSHPERRADSVGLLRRLVRWVLGARTHLTLPDGAGQRSARVTATALPEAARNREPGRVRITS
jgi:hypothetical protein